eukprot:291842-Pyramimonas_sp.AAC.1
MSLRRGILCAARRSSPRSPLRAGSARVVGAAAMNRPGSGASTAMPNDLQAQSALRPPLRQ